mmetsp:Transcript_28327/g.67499  ORF Transcript_28327/g.67499 Transcript_28327/m.67499 type:complete len:126 (-) Transcript_28327:150-527(-)
MGSHIDSIKCYLYSSDPVRPISLCSVTTSRHHHINMIVESSRDGSASPRPNFDSELTKHVLNTSDMLLMLFDFARRYQKLPLGVLLHALLDSFQPLAAPPRFSSTNKKDDDSKRPQWQGSTPHLS